MPCIWTHRKRTTAMILSKKKVAFAVLLLASAQTVHTSPITASAANPQAAMDRDLLEIDIPQLEAFYRDHKYTVTQVVHWYLDRVRRYNGVYGAFEYVDEAGALATASQQDADARAGGATFHRGPMWGVPIVIKENTSVRGLLTSDGWKGYVLPGHELTAPRDATIVAKLRAAGAVMLGKTNMPDFAASDTNRSTAYGRTGNAYDVRFSPGGSSGGTVTAVTANLAILGNGTDTGNSIRMPAATSAVVGVFPTRGLVSIAGIAPLDWLLDNTGPIARDVTDATIALTAMAGEDPADAATIGSAQKAQPGPYTKYLQRKFAPWQTLRRSGLHSSGRWHSLPGESFRGDSSAGRSRPQRIDSASASGDTRCIHARDRGVACSGSDRRLRRLHPAGQLRRNRFARRQRLPYIREGTEKFLAAYGPPQYHSPEEYEKAVGSSLPATIIGGKPDSSDDRPPVDQARFEDNPQAVADVLEPRKRALELYDETLDRLRLDGYVYPAIQMPPPDETMPQDGVLSTGPHSDTGWVNMIGVPAVVVPAGFYPNGLPFGLEISARRWHDGDLLGWAYAFEQATHLRRPPVLVEKGLLSRGPRSIH